MQTDFMGYKISDKIRFLSFVFCAISSLNLLISSWSGFRLKSCFSASGRCYRIGGDEFVVVMEDVSEDFVSGCLKNLQSAVDRENAGRENEISFAYGYAAGKVASSADFSRLCEKADENMYRQKEEMKNA